MLRFDELLIFASKQTHLLIYGAGTYTWTTIPYLLSHGIRPEACLVSGDPAVSHFMDEIEEYSIADFDIKTGEQYGIILSLQEVFHDDVKNNIKEKFGECTEIFVLNDDDIRYLGQIFRTNRMLDMLKQDEELNQAIKEEYEIREKKLFSENKKIILRFIDMRYIGCFISWIYWSYQRNINQEDGLFWLFWPASSPSHKNTELTGFNKYMLSKLKCKGMEVINADSLSFWRYLYKKNKESFIIDNGYSISEWNKQLNTFILLHGGKIRGEYLNFDRKENILGMEKAREMGIKGKYISFFVRDNLYVNKVMKLTTDVHKNVCKYRNCPIEDYKSVAEKLKDKGLQVVRMGAMVEKKIKWENTIDYASSYRSEFMDAWLFANCEFFVCTPSGIQAIPQLFSKPMAMFNLTIQSTRNDYGMFTNTEKDLAIIVRYKLKEENRFLTLREMLEIETDEKLHTMATVGAYKAYDNLGVEIVKNTAKEVIDMTEEMVARLNGTADYSEDDKYLQKEYRHIVDRYPMRHNFPFIFRMGAKFLKENQWLLG